MLYYSFLLRISGMATPSVGEYMYADVLLVFTWRGVYIAIYIYIPLKTYYSYMYEYVHT